LALGLSLAAAGATIDERGAESTRPGGAAISPEVEWERLEPVLAPLVGAAPPGVAISVDTRHPATAERAIEAGARWINDVTGFASPGMRRAVRAASVELVAMHSLSVPVARGALLPPEADAVEVVLEWARRRLAELERDGIDPARVIIDPGVGFGKSGEQNVALIRDAAAFLDLGVRVLVGHSRKSFLGRWFEPTEPAAALPAERDLETAVLSAALAAQQVDYLRVHDVRGSARALRAWSYGGPALA
jgi:dihydropteroate synthase